jgi:hypothetical protein
MTTPGLRKALLGFAALLSMAACDSTAQPFIAIGGPLSAAPISLTFGSLGEALPLMLTDPLYTGAFTSSGCAGIVSSTVSGETVTVTSVAVGVCTLAIVDGSKRAVAVPVTVSTLSVPVQ